MADSINTNEQMIKRISDENERLDVDNGFLLCPNHDKAFDKGYITFDTIIQFFF